jgi:filamentous hemagglutinin family protein
MGTRVNGNAVGICRAGSCAINGGVRAGKNLFHQLGTFDTRHGITDVRLDTRKQKNIILGVTGQQGLFLNKPLRLTSAANLFLLSPNGIWIGSGVSFVNAPNLLLSTSFTLNIGRDRYDLFSTSQSLAKQLSSSPSLDWKTLSDPLANPSNLGLSGDGSIILGGGRIAVDRHLLVNAPSGMVKSTADALTSLQANESVRVAGGAVDLKSITISTGYSSPEGTIHVSSSGDGVQLDAASLFSRNIVINGGIIHVKNSQLLSPNGSIEMRASHPTPQENSINISTSNLDISPQGLEAGSRPVNLDERSRIALYSEGSVNISHSRLSTFSESTPSHLQEAVRNDFPSQPPRSRSGVIFIKAKNLLALDSSYVAADGQNSRAGEIVLVVDGEDSGGGIRINQSRISASNGMGGGIITLSSSSGIKLGSSELVTTSNRFPVVHGNAFGLLNQDDEEQLRPYAFQGGQITLNNSSTTTAITLDQSKLLSLQSTAGGGLENSFFQHTQGDQEGFIGKDIVFSLGYQSDFSGGAIALNSKGGITIQNKSLIDSSSRQEKDHQLENIAGSIAVVNSGQQPILVQDSAITAMGAPPKGITNRDHAVGMISMLNDGMIEINNSRLDTSADASKSLYQTNQSFIGLSSSQSQLLFTGKNKVDAALFLSKDGQVVASGYLNFYPLQSPINHDLVDVRPDKYYEVFVPGDPRNISASLERLSSLLQSQAQESFAAKSSLTNEISSAPTSDSSAFLFRRPQVPASLSQAGEEVVAVTNNLEDDTSNSTILDWQQRSLESTLKSLGLSPERAKLRGIAELRERLSQASVAAPTGPYTPAILNLRREDQPSGITRLNAILLTATSEPISSSVDVPRADLERWIRSFQRQLSRRASPIADAARDPARHLSRALIEPFLPNLREQGITALLLEADRGLQAIPYGALPLMGRPLGDTFALTITPSLGLIDLDPSDRARRAPEGQLLLAGASAFRNGLEPLPMVRQELGALAAEHPSTTLLDQTFTPTALLNQALATGVRRLHIATHATFQPDQTSNGVLYTPTTSLSLADLGRGLRSRPSASPLDLISLSGCVTALGDERSELGFVGMALQAGARSGLGTLWEVDDAATAAFFIQFYRHLKLGLSKDLALQATQRAFLRGEVGLQGDRLVGPDPTNGGTRSTLVSGLSQEQRTLFALGLDHPYYWAGMVLSGSPW